MREREREGGRDRERDREEGTERLELGDNLNTGLLTLRAKVLLSDTRAAL